MLKIGDIIAWCGGGRGDNCLEFVGLIVDRLENGKMVIKPMSPRFIEEVESLDKGSTVALNINNDFTLNNRWRRLA